MKGGTYRTVGRGTWVFEGNGLAKDFRLTELIAELQDPIWTGPLHFGSRRFAENPDRLWRLSYCGALL